MKRIMALFLIICLSVFAGGCSKKEEKGKQSAPTALVAYAAYQYEGGYRLSEGWMYDMTISAPDQLAALEGLVRGLKTTVHDELFDHGVGYHLVFSDADGNRLEELLILESGMVSRDGLMYEAEGTEALLDWLHGLRLEEQHID